MRAGALGTVALALTLLAPLASAQAQNWRGHQGHFGGQHWHHGNRQAAYRYGNHQQGGHWGHHHWRHAQWRHGPWGRPGYYHPHPRPQGPGYQAWNYAPPPPPVVYAPPQPIPGLSLFFNFR